MTPETLTSELRELGVSPGDAVLVHSSLSGLGWVDGGATAAVGALLAAVGEEGTVMFPTLTGNRTNGPKDPPVIDLATTPGWLWLGIMPAAARQRPDAIRSIHPTHSIVAIGANQAFWTQGHEQSASPCDETSPFFRLMEQGAKILLLGGVTHESNTSLHCIEEIATVPYHLQDEFTDGVVILPNGEAKIVRNRLHLWRNRYSHFNLARNFDVVSGPLVETGAQQSRHIGPTVSLLINAGKMRETLLPILKQDPLYLLEES